MTDRPPPGRRVPRRNSSTGERRGVGALETGAGQDTGKASRAGQAAMAGQETREAMADPGTRALFLPVLPRQMIYGPPKKKKF